MSFGYLLPARAIAGNRIAWSIFALHAVLQNSGDTTHAAVIYGTDGSMLVDTSH